MKDERTGVGFDLVSHITSASPLAQSLLRGNAIVFWLDVALVTSGTLKGCQSDGLIASNSFIVPEEKGK